MTRTPQILYLADGRRLHLHDGPIDLIVEASGSESNMRAAYDAAARRVTGLLDELCGELPLLRRAADPRRCLLQGTVARRMHEAVAPFAADCFITPMAAVAGAVAEEILGAMLQAAPLERAYVNNGGDIALHLADGKHFTVGLADRPDAPGLMRTMVISSDDPTRGVGALSGHEIEDALEAGADRARKLLAAGLIDGAALRLHGEMIMVATRALGMPGSETALQHAMESAMHA